MTDSRVLRNLGTVDIGPDFELRLDLRARHGTRWIGAGIWQRVGAERIPRGVIFFKAGEGIPAAVAEAFARAAAQIEGGAF